MRSVIVCGTKDVRKKIIASCKSTEGFNYYFMSDSNDLNDDFALIKPDYLILDGEMLESLKNDLSFLTAHNSIQKLIIIGKSDSRINLPIDLAHIILAPDFSIKEFEKAFQSSNSNGYPKAISGEKIPAAELHHDKRFLQMLMENIPDTIYFKDTKSRFTLINQAKARSLGIKDPAEAIGKTDADYFDAARAKKNNERRTGVDEVRYPHH
jgi:PAS domain-containing protein